MSAEVFRRRVELGRDETNGVGGDRLWAIGVKIAVRHQDNKKGASYVPAAVSDSRHPTSAGSPGWLPPMACPSGMPGAVRAAMAGTRCVYARKFCGRSGTGVRSLKKRRQGERKAGMIEERWKGAWVYLSNVEAMDV